MERTSIKTLREKVRAAGTDRKKRMDISENFFAEAEENAAVTGETRCSRCGKVFEPGDRIFWYHGAESFFCDICFCDELEAQIYGSNGISFEDEIGGGTICVAVEGEEPLFRGI